MQFQKPYQIVKSEKYEKFCASKLLIWRQKWTTGVRHGTSLAVRRVSSGTPIVVLFWPKYAFPHQIKPGILKLTTSKGHSNLITVFSFELIAKRKAIIVSFRSYCGRSCRKQGALRTTGAPKMLTNQDSAGGKNSTVSIYCPECKRRTCGQLKKSSWFRSIRL